MPGTSGAFSPGLAPERPGLNINTCAMTNASALADAPIVLAEGSGRRCHIRETGQIDYALHANNEVHRDQRHVTTRSGRGKMPGRRIAIPRVTAAIRVRAKSRNSHRK